MLQVVPVGFADYSLGDDAVDLDSFAHPLLARFLLLVTEAQAGLVLQVALVDLALQVEMVNSNQPLGDGPGPGPDDLDLLPTPPLARFFLLLAQEALVVQVGFRDPDCFCCSLGDGPGDLGLPRIEDLALVLSSFSSIFSTWPDSP